MPPADRDGEKAPEPPETPSVTAAATADLDMEAIRAKDETLQESLKG